jgi:signal transduction histidine kinase
VPSPPPRHPGADPAPYPHDDDLAAREQAALRRLAGIVAAGADPAEVFAAVAYEVAQVTGMALVQIQRYGPDDTVTVAGAWGVQPHPLQAGRDAAGAPIVVDGELWGAMAAGPAKGAPVPPGLEHRLAAFTELVATAIASMDSREALARLAAEQAALRRVATLVARGVAPAEVFAAVAREAGRLIGVDAMHVGRYEDGGATCVGGWSPVGQCLPIGTRVELDGVNVASRVLRDGSPARLDGPSPAGAASTAERLRHRMGVTSSVGVPIVVDGATWGLMIASAKEPLPAGTESRLLGFTELAETSIANAEARAALGASRARLVVATDAERRRVVRDLHDGAQQRLVHTIVTLKLAVDELHDRAGPAAELVQEALAHAEAATAELRELAHGILPGVLLRGGLRAGADALASRMTVPVAVDVPAQRLPEHVEATAYFVVAEALTNVAKHAGAQRAAVTARVEGGALRLAVSDDGGGGARVEGGGLIGLRDRLATLDGTFAVESPPGRGTVVSATIPLSAPT